MDTARLIAGGTLAVAMAAGIGPGAFASVTGELGPEPPVGIAEATFVGPSTVVLDAGGSLDPDDVDFKFDVPATARWRFGDGTTGRGAKVRHTYPRRGRYVVTLTVHDAEGRRDRDVTVVDGRAVRPYIVRGRRTPTGFTVNATCTRHAWDRCGGEARVWWDGAPRSVASFAMLPGKTLTVRVPFPKGIRSRRVKVLVGMEDSAWRPREIHWWRWPQPVWELR